MCASSWDPTSTASTVRVERGACVGLSTVSWLLSHPPIRLGDLNVHAEPVLSLTGVIALGTVHCMALLLCAVHTPALPRSLTRTAAPVPVFDTPCCHRPTPRWACSGPRLSAWSATRSTWLCRSAKERCVWNSTCVRIPAGACTADDGCAAWLQDVIAYMQIARVHAYGMMHVCCGCVNPISRLPLSARMSHPLTKQQSTFHPPPPYSPSTHPLAWAHPSPPLSTLDPPIPRVHPPPTHPNGYLQVLDQHLDLIVGQTEAYSKMLAQNLAKAESDVEDAGAGRAVVEEMDEDEEQEEEGGEEEEEEEEDEEEGVEALAQEEPLEDDHPQEQPLEEGSKAGEQQQQQQPEHGKRRRSSSDAGAVAPEGAAAKRPRRSSAAAGAKAPAAAAAAAVGAQAPKEDQKPAAGGKKAGEDDKDFGSEEEESDDDEATLEAEERLAEEDEEAPGDELGDLEDEANLPIEQLLAKWVISRDAFPLILES